jgi:hypothetical protein
MAEEQLTGTGIIYATMNERGAERMFEQCAGDAMLEFGEFDPENYRYAIREVARIAARLGAQRAVAAVKDIERLAATLRR